MSDLHIIHVDMDAFFAAIEQRDQPSLKGKPVVVGGRSESRGVVSTASYEARTYGIHSGMPMREALRLCPTAIYLPVNMAKYKEVSGQIKEILYSFTHLIEPLSVDEAFLDVENEDAVSIGRKLKNKITYDLDLTASVGVSYNKFLAKLASDMEKPDGFTIVGREKAKSILPGMPVRKLWGIGPKTEQELHRVGLFTFADVASADRMLLSKVVGKRAEEIQLLSQGIDHRKVQVAQPAKSFGEETTLSSDTESSKVLREYLADFSGVLSRRLQRGQIKARTVTVKIRYDDFTDVSRSRTSQEALSSQPAILDEAIALLGRMVTEGRRVRLIGLQVSGFLLPDQPEQILFDFYHEI